MRVCFSVGKKMHIYHVLNLPLSSMVHTKWMYSSEYFDNLKREKHMRYGDFVKISNNIWSDLKICSFSAGFSFFCCSNSHTFFHFHPIWAILPWVQAIFQLFWAFPVFVTKGHFQVCMMFLPDQQHSLQPTELGTSISLTGAPQICKQAS